MDISPDLYDFERRRLEKEPLLLDEEKIRKLAEEAWALSYDGEMPKEYEQCYRKDYIQGCIKGRLKVMFQCAVKPLEHGLAHHLIAELTELSLSTVNALSKEMQRRREAAERAEACAGFIAAMADPEARGEAKVVWSLMKSGMAPEFIRGHTELGDEVFAKLRAFL